MKRTDAKIEKEIINEYVSGLSCNKIAQKYNMNQVTVFNILKRNDIQLRTKGGINKLPINDIINSYYSGIKVVDLAKKYNVTEGTIYNYLEEAGISRNYIYYNRSLNRNYFHIIDSYDKAYFLGLILSDGCIVGNELSITLKASDFQILEIFRQKISNENPLYYSNRGEVVFHCKSKELVNDLSKYGVVPRKSFITYLPQIDPDFMNHLIRGYFDGNGWITTPHTIGFCAGSEMMIQNIHNLLIPLLDLYIVTIIHNRNVYQCSWTSKQDFLKLGQYMYNDAYDCYLQRKFDKFMTISS